MKFPYMGGGKFPCNPWEISMCGGEGNFPPTPLGEKCPSNPLSMLTMKFLCKGEREISLSGLEGNFPECGFLDSDDSGMWLVFYLKV